MPATTISIIIAAVNEWDSLEECLHHLAPELQRHADAEILVLTRRRDHSSGDISRVCPGVRIFEENAHESIPRLRAKGIEEAYGEWVVILEDHCMVEPGWLDHLSEAIAAAAGFGVVGGAVVNGSPDRLVDWAAFLCEYSFSMPPLERGEAAGVTGNNVGYRKSVLTSLVPPSELTGRWEYFWHQKLRSNGVRFFCAPEIVVLHQKKFPFGYFMRQRFCYSRSFAAMRAEDMSMAKRYVYAAASPLLVPLVAWRTARQVFRKRTHLREFILSFPILIFFLMSYAAGEAYGHVAGVGGSLEKVE